MHIPFVHISWHCTRRRRRNSISPPLGRTFSQTHRNEQTSPCAKTSSPTTACWPSDSEVIWSLTDAGIRWTHTFSSNRSSKPTDLIKLADFSSLPRGCRSFSLSLTRRVLVYYIFCLSFSVNYGTQTTCCHKKEQRNRSLVYKYEEDLSIFAYICRQQRSTRSNQSDFGNLPIKSMLLHNWENAHWITAIHTIRVGKTFTYLSLD